MQVLIFFLLLVFTFFRHVCVMINTDCFRVQIVPTSKLKLIIFYLIQFFVLTFLTK